MPEAPNTPLFAQRFFKRLTKAYADILDRVVVIKLVVAAAVQIDKKVSVPRHRVEHVIEKRDAGIDDRCFR